jgi:hypothetical protein
VVETVTMDVEWGLLLVGIGFVYFGLYATTEPEDVRRRFAKGNAEMGHRLVSRFYSDMSDAAMQVWGIVFLCAGVGAAVAAFTVRG